MTRPHAIAALACLFTVASAFAAEPAAINGPVFVAPTPTFRTQTDARCGAKPVPVCTRDRVAALRQLSDDLARAAALPPDTRPQTAAVQQELTSFNDWLNGMSAETATLASQGEQAIIQSNLQMSFNMQFLALQSRIQQESQRFSSISNVLKTKHDTAKNSISNMR